MSEKIVLIDGHSILNRAFYGIPDLTNAEGLHTNAVYGFLNIMFKVLEEEKPEYLTVAFDVHAPTFRHEMFEEYKGTRKPMAEELRQQVPVIKEVLHAMGVRTVEKAGLEADDILGTISARCEREGLDVVIISGDRDILQVATDHVKIRIPKTKQGRTEVEDYLAADVKERYQVTPREFIDVKALMGDASDNIPGVPSIGEKTATKLIVEYGSIENAYAHVDEIKPPRAAKALKEHYDMAQLSKVLATINIDADLDYAYPEARLGNLYTEEAYTWFQKLQFKNLLGRFEVSAPANTVEEYFRTVKGRAAAEEIFRKASGQKTIGISIEKDASGLLPLFAAQAEVSAVGIAFSGKEIFRIAVGADCPAEYLLEQVQKLSGETETCAMFEIKEKMKELPALDQSRAFDIKIAAYLLNPLKNHYTPDEIAQETIGLLMDEKAETGIRTCYEAYISYACAEPLFEKLTQAKMDRLFCEIEMPLVFALADMERVGVKVEGEALQIYGDQLSGRIAELEKSICEQAGESFNINSPKQLGVILFEKLMLPHGKKTKSGYSTAADILEKLAPDYPIVSEILEYRQMTKLKSTYADGLAAFIGPDGRIHGKFHQTVTATGRISSTDPNLQNIPVRMELGRLIRKVFIPEKDYVFVDADYSQI
ncbi:MAG TPA: DNA polymerase I, partial [Lachnospiraceae bacterium]|nr:DNA polymerase I [Lachnospiraceae bacterium]